LLQRQGGTQEARPRACTIKHVAIRWQNKTGAITKRAWGGVKRGGKHEKGNRRKYPPQGDYWDLVASNAGEK